MKYKVISNENFTKFQEEVNEHLKKEWKLQGGISAIGGMILNAYFQAMVKDEDGK